MNTEMESVTIYSDLGGDPDLGDLVALFVEEMPDRAATIRSHHAAGERELLRRAAHQLKGAAGSYGFAPISAAAAELDMALRSGAPDDRIAAGVERLVHLCLSARAGIGPSGV